MAKISGLCSSNEHSSCPSHLFSADGKRFACGCRCHDHEDEAVVARRKFDEDDDGA